VVLLYERLLTDLDRGTSAIERSRPGEAHEALVHAQDIVSELRLALDPAVWSGAVGLDAIYRHLEVLLVEANVTKSAAVVEQCRRLVAPLSEAWSEAYRSVVAERADTLGRVLA
jgi:flagellar protein FliS